MRKKVYIKGKIEWKERKGRKQGQEIGGIRKAPF